MQITNGLYLDVINELKMTDEDINVFTEPHVVCEQYKSTIIYTIDAYQLSLFENILLFDEDRTTLRQKQQDLIMHIDNHPYYKDSTYKLIWCKFAHHYFLNDKEPISIRSTDFQRPRRRNQIRNFFTFAQPQHLLQPQQQNISIKTIFILIK